MALAVIVVFGAVGLVSMALWRRWLNNIQGWPDDQLVAELAFVNLDPGSVERRDKIVKDLQSRGYRLSFYENGVVSAISYNDLVKLIEAE